MFLVFYSKVILLRVINLYMQNIRLKNKELSKIEFLVPTLDKIKFQELCKENSFGMAEIMKSAFGEKLNWLKSKNK